MNSTEEERPLVSIIVRTKDRPKLLTNAIGSIASQTYRHIEVILVNDGGCEISEEGLRKTLGDIHLNYIRSDVNRGRASAGNTGIEHSRGDFIGFLDDDDQLYPEHVSILANFLLKSDYKAAYTDARLIRRNYDPEKKEFEDIDGGVFMSEDFSYDVLLFENYIPLTTILFHRDIFNDIGTFSKELEIFEDWDLLIRMAGKYPLHHIAKVTTKYVQWSRDYQIANSGLIDSRSRYLEILNEYSSGRTSEAVFNYYLRKLEQAEKRDDLIKQVTSENLSLNKVIEELTSALHASDKELQTAHKELQATKGELQEGMLAAKEEERRLKDELHNSNAFIEEVRAGIGWKILEYYRLHIKKRIAPIGSSRWKIYNKCLKGIKSYKTHGMKTSAGKVIRLLRETKASSNIRKEDFIIPDIRETSITPSDIKVSVVIPTMNAGEDFTYLLERIRRQKGLKDIEIVIVDSASTDDTVAIANRYGAKILSIKPGEFNHGKTRDLGARHATGDYLFITTQDAIPIGFTCFAEIVEGMKNDSKIAAVSVKQIPRSDADLFSCWQLWNHYEKFLKYSDDKVVSIGQENFESLCPSDRRRMAQLDDVFSCIRKDVFDQYGFNKVQYAEDLDLGLRLMKDGYKIGFLSSVGVIHSHNRDPLYYFKRSVIDRIILISSLGYDPVDWKSTGINSLSDMVQYVQAGYHKLNSALQSLEPGISGDTGYAGLFESLRSLMLSPQDCSNLPGIDREMDSIIEQLVSSSGAGDTKVTVTSDVLTEQFLSVLEGFREFLNSCKYTGDRGGEIVSSLYKLHAVVLGANIGDYMLFQERNNGDKRPAEFDEILGCHV